MADKPNSPRDDTKAPGLALALKKPGARKQRWHVAQPEDQVRTPSTSGVRVRRRVLRTRYLECFTRNYGTHARSSTSIGASFPSRNAASLTPLPQPDDPGAAHALQLPRLADLAEAFASLPRSISEFGAAWAKAAKSERHAPNL